MSVLVFDARTAEKIFWAGALALFTLSVGLAVFGDVFHSWFATIGGGIVVPALLVAWGPLCRRYLSDS